jgi:energy-coupling factor transport system permease protein
MMAASKAADELSIASVTRGIENPKPRTCLVQIQLGLADAFVILCFFLYWMAAFVWKGVF